MSESQRHRPIRSFVRREGRLTLGQQRAIDTFWTNFGVDPGPRTLRLEEVFQRRAPRVLEIGFGDGESLAAMAARHPEEDYLGIEVHRPGVGHLLQRADRLGLTNLKVMCADAVEVLTERLPDACFIRIQIFFPDPWPKKRHHKRRLIQPPFALLLARKLRPGGHLHLATDWEDYAHHMLRVLETAAPFVNTAGLGRFTPRPAYRPLTKFEHRGQRLGHGVRDLVFKRI